VSANVNDRDDVGRVPSHGASVSSLGETSKTASNAGSGDPACSASGGTDVGPVPSPGVHSSGFRSPAEPSPRRLRRLHRVWPDRDGNISYLLTLCVDGRVPVLNNEDTFQRFVAFLLDSPECYHWFGRRFVVMPDHIHLIARMGHDAVRLGQWIKALKAVVAGLKRREAVCDDERPAGEPGRQDAVPSVAAGRVPSHGDFIAGPMPSSGVRKKLPHKFTRLERAWRWQDGCHDHKFRTPESESRKWEYVCLNPVRYGLVKRPEEWPYGGEIFYDDAGGPRLVRGTPPLLERGLLIAEDHDEMMPREDGKTPGKGSRHTT